MQSVVSTTREAERVGRRFASPENRELAEHVATKVFYELFSTLLSFESRAEAVEWWKECHRVGPPWSLALAVKSVSPRAPPVHRLLRSAWLVDFRVDALAESFERLVVDDGWWSHVLSFLASSRASERRTCDVSFLVLYWQRVYSTELGDGYRVSGVGVSTEARTTRNPSATRRSPVAGFFSFLRVDPTIATRVADSFGSRKCIVVDSVGVHGTGKLERLGTRRGSEIRGDWGWSSLDDFLEGNLRDALQVPYVPTRRLEELGGLEGLPFDFARCVWGPAVARCDRECLILDSVHPVLPDDVRGDKLASNVLALGSEFLYLPVATIVDPATAEGPRYYDVAWFRKVPCARERLEYLVDVAKLGRALASLSLETRTGERVEVLLPTTEGLNAGYTARDFFRVPADFVERVVGSLEGASGRGEGVLFWLEPVLPRLGKFEVPRVGLLFSPTPSEFTGGYESLYLRGGVTKLGEVRRRKKSLREWVDAVGSVGTDWE